MISAISTKNATNIPIPITTYTPSMLLRSMCFRDNTARKEEDGPFKSKNKKKPFVLEGSLKCVDKYVVCVLDIKALPLSERLPFYAKKTDDDISSFVTKRMFTDFSCDSHLVDSHIIDLLTLMTVGLQILVLLSALKSALKTMCNGINS